MPSDLNNVAIVGRLTRDPEMRTMPSGASLCEASVAVNSSQKKGGSWEEYASFFNVAAFGNTADTLAKRKKGERVGIVGKLVQRRWEASDGSKRERVQISADRITLFSEGTKRRVEAAESVDDGMPF